MWRDGSDGQGCKRLQGKVSFQSEEEVWEVWSGVGTIYNATEMFERINLMQQGSYLSL